MSSWHDPKFTPQRKLRGKRAWAEALVTWVAIGLWAAIITGIVKALS